MRKYIPKSELIDKVTYAGHCRNSTKATWHADLNRFLYTRRKFGDSFIEEINHPEDDDGFDLFYPSSLITS